MNQLAAWLDANPNLSRAELARQLGVVPPYVSLMAAGERRPGLDLAFLLEDISKGAVPARSWYKRKQASGDRGQEVQRGGAGASATANP